MISEIKEIYCTDLELVEHSSGEKVSI
jgi:hypothetical protein